VNKTTINEKALVQINFSSSFLNKVKKVTTNEEEKERMYFYFYLLF